MTSIKKMQTPNKFSLNLGNFLRRGSSGGATVWRGDMGDFGANVSEVRGSAGGSLAAGNKKKDKEAEGWFVAADGRKIVLQGAGTHPLQTYMDMRQATVA